MSMDSKKAVSERFHRRLIICISYLSMGMLGIYITLYQYTILSISQLYMVNAAVMGVLIAMQHIGISVPPLFLGPLSAKIGKKKVTMISFALIVLGTFLVGITQNFAAFIVSVFIIGAGFSVTEGTLSAILSDEFPDESTKHLNFSQVAFSAGAMAGPFISAALIGCGVYFKDLFLYVSAIFLLLLILFAFTRQQNDNCAAKEKAVSFSLPAFLKNRVFLLLAIGIFLYVGVENTVANFADSYFELALGAPVLSAAALSLFWGGMIPSRFLAGILKVDLKKMFLVLSALVFGAAIAAMLVPDNTVKVVLFMVCGFGCGPLWPLMMDAVAKKNRGATGPALNVMMSFSGLGGAALPIFAGLLVNAGGQAAAYYLCAAAAALMAVMYNRSLKN